MCANLFWLECITNSLPEVVTRTVSRVLFSLCFPCSSFNCVSNRTVLGPPNPTRPKKFPLDCEPSRELQESLGPSGPKIPKESEKKSPEACGPGVPKSLEKVSKKSEKSGNFQVSQSLFGTLYRLF